jgi:hypothetical protein
MLNTLKIVVFDMDETLGYFMEFGIFWNSLNFFINEYHSKQIISNQELFDKTLCLYPEFIRPNILTVLNYLKKKKQSNDCKKVIIYTNNQDSKEWVFFIKNYFEKQLNYQLFDNIICAYKIDGKQIELCRSCHHKTHRDFLNCSKMPENTQICFLDNSYHSEMHNDNVYYIKVNSYVYNLNIDEIIRRFINSDIFSKTLKDFDLSPFIHFVKLHMYEYEIFHIEKNKREYEVDKIVTKKILEYIHLFFKKKNNAFILENRSIKEIIYTRKKSSRKQHLNSTRKRVNSDLT